MNKILARLRALLAVASPVRKAVGSVLGGATGVGVDSALDAVSVHVSTPVAAAIAVILGVAGTWLAPPNAPKPVQLAVVPPAPGGRVSPPPAA